MQVNQVSDHVTHAVIGGAKTVNMGISDSAEFFSILSSTLYSDQPMAVVREVLCNAWDAHIEAGRTDRAIEITLDNDEVVFRDFGTGIHDDDMGPIYGVYGSSTKKANGAVTGGFGLGCKAPFAFTDHFEVTSWHDGLRTIYNLSKSSAEVNGKPGITPIASFPTTESGLQVRIPLKGRADYDLFYGLILRVVSNGGMKVQLNGVELSTYPWESMGHGFMITTESVGPRNDISALYVRYGNVVYPVPYHEDYGIGMKKVRDLLKAMPLAHQASYQIVFQAPPHSISVTPSRESLSMQGHTIATLKSLIDGFNDQLAAVHEKYCMDTVHEVIAQSWQTMQPSRLLQQTGRLPWPRDLWNPRREDIYITDFASLMRAYLWSNYPEYPGFQKKEILARVNSLVESQFGNRGLINSYRAELMKPIKVQPNWTYYQKQRAQIRSSWFHKKVLWPLIRDLRATDSVNPDRLMVIPPGSNNYGEHVAIPIRSMPPRGLDYYLPYLRNIVVIAHRKTDLHERICKFPVIKHWLGNLGASLLYVVPQSSPNQIQAARKFFGSRDFVVIDLTMEHPWEPKLPAPIASNDAAAPKKKKVKTGLPLLSSLTFKNGVVDMRILDHNAAIVSDQIVYDPAPKIVGKLPRGKEDAVFEEFDHKGTKAIARLWGNQIGIVSDIRQVQAAVLKGAERLNDFAAREVCREMAENKNIHNAIAYGLGYKTGFYSHEEDIYDAVMEDPVLRKTLGIKFYLSEDELHYFHLWERTIRDMYQYRDIANPVRAKINKIQVKDPAKALVTKINTSQLIRNSIEVFRLRNKLRTALSLGDTDLAKRIRAILLSAIG